MLLILKPGSFQITLLAAILGLNYVLGASDLLLFELLNMSLEFNKDYIHLGLGVNAGIRRFKEKWGGLPSRRYEMCELAFQETIHFRYLPCFRKMALRLFAVIQS